MKTPCKRCGSLHCLWLGWDEEAGPHCSDCFKDLPEAIEIGRIKEAIYNGMTVDERTEQMSGVNLERKR